MGVFPARSAASFASSTSTQLTECPVSAKQVPATRPTYPVPTTAMRIGVRPSVTADVFCFTTTAAPTILAHLQSKRRNPALCVRRNPGVGQAQISNGARGRRNRPPRLLDGDALRQVARLIDVGAAVIREVVAEQLCRDHGDDGLEQRVRLRDADRVLRELRNHL